jgi:hypothetical protein
LGGANAGVDHMNFLGIAGSDLVEDVEKIGVVGLAVDGFEFNDVDTEVFGDFAIEEEGAVEMVGEEFAFGGVANDWFELPDVTECNEGDASEWVGGFSIALEGDVDGVEEVGADHGDFIKVDELESVDEAAFWGSRAEGGNIAGFGIHWAGSESEEAVDGLTAGVKGGNSCGGERDAFEWESLAEMPEEGGFSGTGPSGDEYEPPAERGFFDLFYSGELFFGELDIRGKDWGGHFAA